MEREIGFLKADVIKSNEEIRSSMDTFGSDLLGGLGSEMEDYLKNPPKEDTRLRRKVRRARKFDNFKRKFSRLVLGEKEKEDD